jgi:UDP:flavonoid glycosyltransferase YjiC (YdhE family)
MNAKHVLLFLEHQYGHINPSLGMAMELVSRGHDVRYATRYATLESFAPLFRSIGATPVLLDTIENREEAVRGVFKENDHLNYNVATEHLANLCDAIRQPRTARSFVQLEQLYRDQKPALIIRDDILDAGGREFASKYAIPSALLRSQYIERDLSEACVGEELVLVTVPAFFQRLDEGTFTPPRFKFVGFTPEGRTVGFQPWRLMCSSSDLI